MPNDVSIGAPYERFDTLLGMPKTTQAERLLRVREAAGFGGPRNAAKFARKIGIAPASLHDLESGETRNLGKSLQGYLKIGANPAYIFDGKGLPLLRDIEKSLHVQTLVSMMMELDDDQQRVVEELIKTFIRSSDRSSPNDPYKEDVPRPKPHDN
jgi:transcriptional regulator with XRE-family HTH domain